MSYTTYLNTIQWERHRLHHDTTQRWLHCPKTLVANAIHILSYLPRKFLTYLTSKKDKTEKETSKKPTYFIKYLLSHGWWWQLLWPCDDNKTNKRTTLWQDCWEIEVLNAPLEHFKVITVHTWHPSRHSPLPLWAPNPLFLTTLSVFTCQPITFIAVPSCEACWRSVITFCKYSQANHWIIISFLLSPPPPPPLAQTHAFKKVDNWFSVAGVIKNPASRTDCKANRTVFPSANQIWVGVQGSISCRT